MKYDRILLKLSGEQLAGKFESGIDPEFAAWLAKEVQKVINAGCQVVIVAGGGNMVRGAKVAGHGIKRVTADQMGMLSGLINAVALTDIFENQGLPTRCLSNIYAQQVAESYSFRLAEKHLEKGRVVIVAGGIARPYLTHDTAAVSLALELDCQAVIKSTKVDGVYDKDPAQHKDAKRHAKLSHQQALADPQIKVLDKAALGMAMDHGMPMIVANVLQKDNLLQKFAWVSIIFGLILARAAYKAFKEARGGDEIEEAVEFTDKRLWKAINKLLPIHAEYDGHKLTTRVNGKRMLTLMAAVIILIELTDVIFAVDSVPAVLAVSPDRFIAYSSNVFALLGLRALFFVYQSVADRFWALAWGLAGILAWISFKMIVTPLGLHVPIPISLAVLTLLLGGSIVLSLLKPKKAPKHLIHITDD